MTTSREQEGNEMAVSGPQQLGDGNVVAVPVTTNSMTYNSYATPALSWNQGTLAPLSPGSIIMTNTTGERVVMPNTSFTLSWANEPAKPMEDLKKAKEAFEKLHQATKSLTKVLVNFAETHPIARVHLNNEIDGIVYGSLEYAPENVAVGHDVLLEDKQSMKHTKARVYSIDGEVVAYELG